jgi:phospholipid transport system substrate-binding protein
MTLTRRALVMGAAALVAILQIPHARAEDASAAAGFIQEFGGKLVDVVNGPGSLPEKEQRLRPLIDSAVDVDAIARFCLGRYVTSATPQQVAEFTNLFHAVLVNNITSKTGEYRGVTFRMADSSMRGSEAFVGTIVTRPQSAPTNVRWVVSTATGAPKIVDVVAEGTSLRLTQRSDYSSYLSHNGNNLDTLIAAMRRQVSAS